MTEAIIVGTDGSETAERAVSEAIRLAKALGAEVHIVSAYDPFGGVAVVAASLGAAVEVMPEPAEAAGSAVASAQEAARAAQVPVRTHAVPGEPAEALLEVAATVGASLIVVGNKGMHGARRVLGSVPNTVSHKASCNVLIVSTDLR